jgi:hypothetical protein
MGFDPHFSVIIRMNKEKIQVVCSHCNLNFFMSKKHFKSKNCPEKLFCSNACRNFGFGKSIICNCDNCGKDIQKSRKEFIKSNHHFCNNSCSASFTNSRRKMSEETKKKIQQTLKEKYTSGEIAQKNQKAQKNVKLTCINCSCSFERRRRLKKTCSDACLTEYRRKNIPESFKKGGYRKGAGRSKHGWFDNEYFDSTYELAFYIFCKQKGILIERCKDFFNYVDENGKHRKYYPDFRVGRAKKLIEIKGFYSPSVDLKLVGVKENIKVLYKPDLKRIFSFVEKKTGLKIKKLYLLYSSDPTEN